MTTAILSFKNTVLSRIKEFFAAPQSQESQEISSFTITPISAVLEVASNNAIVNAKDHHDYAFNVATNVDTQGFCVKKNMPFNFALSLISASAMSTLSVIKSEQELIKDNDKKSTYQNLTYMAGLSPVSCIYSAMLAEQKGLVKAPKAQEHNEYAISKLNYLGGLSPISAIYASAFEQSSAKHNANKDLIKDDTQDLELADNKANQTCKPMTMSFALTPISSAYSAFIATQDQYETKTQVQEAKLNTAKLSVNNEHNNFVSKLLERMFIFLGSVDMVGSVNSNILAYEIRAKRDAYVAKQQVHNDKATNKESTFALKALKMLSLMGNVELVSGNSANILANKIRAHHDDNVNHNSFNLSKIAMRLLSYMGALSPISAINAQALAEQLGHDSHEYQMSQRDNKKSFAIENDGFTMSPAMSLISGVFCSALATAEENSAKDKKEQVIIQTLSAQDQNNIMEQHELIEHYQDMYTKRGYDQVQSLIMASVLASCNSQKPSFKPLYDAATEERVAKRWDKIWNQLSVDSSKINSYCEANQDDNIIEFKAPFERYYNANGELKENMAA